MPELPEVETVRRGLAPAMEGAVFADVLAHRPDLRFPLPANFHGRLVGAKVRSLGRRGKYMLADLSSGETLIIHLGMTGRFTVREAARPGVFYHDAGGDPAHDHVTFRMMGPAGEREIVYNDARRFGFMDLADSRSLEKSRHFAAMGPEPLAPDFALESFSRALSGRSAPIKAALLDQSIVAGLGNIYVCEALFRSQISPRRKAKSVGAAKTSRLHAAIREVLTEAIEAGGSTLKDFAAADGARGYFQHRFDVYGREGEPCPACGSRVRRIVQSGRSTFYCGKCQR